MGAKKFQLLIKWMIFSCIESIVLALVVSSNVLAQAPSPLHDNGTCIACHEDLYFLHDTGKWFCIRAAPMRCIDCHGGDPTTFSQEDAHASRNPHPILNEDVTKCQECHPAECDERAVIFEHVAGISNVRVAAPYQPASIPRQEQPLDTHFTETAESPAWISAMEVLALALLAGLALIIYFARKKHSNRTYKNR